MKILVTGGTGFIGSNLCEFLSEYFMEGRTNLENLTPAILGKIN